MICLSHISQASTNPPLLVSETIDFLMQMTVPLFFFISGMLFRTDKYASFRLYVWHKTKTLLIPYFALSILFAVLCPYIFHPSYLVEELNYPRHAFLTSFLPVTVAAIIEWIAGDIVCIVIGISSRCTMPLWFVFILYLVGLCFFFVNARLKNWFFTPALVALLLAYVLPRNVILTYLHVQAFFMAFFFYTLGFAYNKMSRRPPVVRFSVFCFALLVYVLVEFRGPNGFVSGLFGDSPVRYLLHVCSGICVVLYLFRLFEKQKVKGLGPLMKPFQYISRNGLPVIAIHFWAMLVYLVFFNKFIQPVFQFPAIFLFVVSAVVLLLPLLNIYIHWTQSSIC